MKEMYAGKNETALQIVAEDKSLWQSSDNAGEIQTQVEQLQSMTAVTPAKFLRRSLFFWLRIYVHQREDNQRINIHIPIPIPLIGALLPQRLPLSQALKLRNQLAASEEPGQVLSTTLDSMMGLELLRVEEDKQLVIIGID